MAFVACVTPAFHITLLKEWDFNHPKSFNTVKERYEFGKVFYLIIR